MYVCVLNVRVDFGCEEVLCCARERDSGLEWTEQLVIYSRIDIFCSFFLFFCLHLGDDNAVAEQEQTELPMLCENERTYMSVCVYTLFCGRLLYGYWSPK